MEENFPRIKKAVLTAKLNVAVDEETKADYEKLKREHGIDMVEIVRRSIVRAVREVKESVREEVSA